MKCNYCDSEIPDNAAKCPVCNAPCRTSGVDTAVQTSDVSLSDVQTVYKVAQSQRRMLVALLILVLFWVGVFIGWFDADNKLVIIALYGISLVCAWYCGRTNWYMSHSVVKTILAVVMALIPVVSLITLLIVSSKVSGFLQASGIKPGFLGVSSANLKRLKEQV